jgi:hypothetical protein
LDTDTAAVSIPKQLPPLEWHDVHPIMTTSFFIPPSPLNTDIRSHRHRLQSSIRDRRTFPSQETSLPSEKIESALKRLNLKDSRAKHPFQWNSLTAELNAKASLVSSITPPQSSVIIDGGEDPNADSSQDINDMIAVLEGLHVSADVIEDSVKAVHANLVKPSVIINIAKAAKEKQVQSFLDAQASMDRWARRP